MRDLIMNKIYQQNFEAERSLYNLVDTTVDSCTFAGKEDGESPLKEGRNISLINSTIDLRYPLWHDINLTMVNATLTTNSRAALWYSKNINITKSKLHGIKAVRECENIEINDCSIISDEFGWRNNNFKILNSKLEGMYAFFESNNIEICDLEFKGKYSFQYVNNMTINNSNFDTKDAFWHAKNVVVRDTILKGEYLAWYSENLTLINCTIIGTQPFCYCKKLKLINCKMIDCDFAFEYSDVEADIITDIVSVKNVLSGYVTCKHTTIINDLQVYPCHGIVNMLE